MKCLNSGIRFQDTSIIFIQILHIIFMHSKTLYILFTLMVVLQTQGYSQSTGWNNNGGNPLRNGFSAVSGPETDSILWEVPSPGLFGTPVFIEDNYLVTMRFQSMTDAPVVCYQLNTGTLLWSVDVTNASGRSLPVGIRDGRVFVVRLTESQNDTLYALDVTNGSYLWTADATVAPYISESAVFDATGNLYIGGFQKTFKINAETGQTIWETTTVPMASGSGELAVNTSNNTGYTLEQSGGISYLWATDLTNGVKKYSKIVNDLQPGGNVPQSALMVGQNEIVYVQLTEDNIAAFSDDGSQFNLLWQTTIIGNSAFSLMCVDNDDAVYAPTGGRLVRLDGLTGDTLALSAYIGEGGLFTPRISASNNNFIYATTGEDSVFAFDKSLNKIWSAYLPNSNTSGVSLAPNGLALVTGANIIRVYTPKTFTYRSEIDQSAIILYPNPTSDYCIIKADQRAMGKRYRLVGVAGQTILAGILWNGTQYLDLSAVPSGTYYLTIDGESRSPAVIKQ